MPPLVTPILLLKLDSGSSTPSNFTLQPFANPPCLVQRAVNVPEARLFGYLGDPVPPDGWQ
jgi:hypothetical protein